MMDVRLVVDHERTVRVLQGGVGSQDRVVRLNDRGRHFRGRVDRELKLGLFAIVGREALHQEGTETGTGTTAERVEHKEALETGTVVGETTDLLEHAVDELLADGVVTTSV